MSKYIGVSKYHINSNLTDFLKNIFTYFQVEIHSEITATANAIPSKE